MMSVKGIAQTGVVVVLSIVLTLAVIETGFRLFKPQQYFAPTVTTWDRETGRKQMPGATGYIKRLEYEMDLITNSKGLRDRDYPYEKPSGTRRILCLGDSFTAGYGVRAEETFPKVLEKLLSVEGDSDYRWEVINAAVGGTGTAHQLAYFNSEGYKYNSDLVLLCLCPANDFWDNTVCGLYSVEGGDLTKHDAPLTVWRRIQCIVQRMPGYHSFFGRLHLMSFARRRVARFHYRQSPALREGKTESAGGKSGADDLTRRLLVALRDACTNSGCRLVMTAVPEGGGRAPPRRTTDIIEFARSQGIPFVDLAPRFHEQVLQGTQLRYEIDRHWNSDGHRLAAEILCDSLMNCVSLGLDSGPGDMLKY